MVKFSENEAQSSGSCEPDAEEESWCVRNLELDVPFWYVVVPDMVFDQKLDDSGRDGGVTSLLLDLALDRRHDGGVDDDGCNIRVES